MAGTSAAIETLATVNVARAAAPFCGFVAGVEADCTEAIFNLGLVNKRLGLLGDALQAFEKLLTLTPNAPEVGGGRRWRRRVDGDADGLAQAAHCRLVVRATRVIRADRHSATRSSASSWKSYPTPHGSSSAALTATSTSRTQVLYHVAALHDALGNYAAAARYFSVLVTRVRGSDACTPVAGQAVPVA